MPDIVVLHVGTDTALLSTRTLVLQQAGLIVVPVTDVADGIKLFLAGDFDLVVLCHSLTLEQRNVMANLVHSHSSSIPVILVGKTNENDMTVDAVLSNHPVKLVKQLAEVLETPPHRRAASRS